MRKACAEVFIDVAASCSLAVRHSHLTKTFVLLLDDDSRWVRGKGDRWSERCGRWLAETCSCDVYTGVWRPLLAIVQSTTDEWTANM